MTSLSVYYDPRCGLCRATRDWLERQRQLVPLVCRPKAIGSDDLVVEADTGEVWTGDAAWLVVIWALARYRPLSRTLAAPALLPTAKAAFATISKYRGALSCGLGLPPEVS
jgi:hypothetical protein